ncbi:MAG: hypothetical protein ACFFD1_13455, partial [Candidatus Thorarchaeota archaeon]
LPPGQERRLFLQYVPVHVYCQGNYKFAICSKPGHLCRLPGFGILYYIYLFKKSYDILKDENITELTWKVLVELANYYLGRGNYSRAKEYISYARSVIHYLAEKIDNEELRKIYLKYEKRRTALRKLEYLELQKN